MPRKKLTPFIVFGDKHSMFRTQHFVSIQETLKLSTPVICGHLKKVQKDSLVLCIFEMYKIQAKWNLTRL